MENSTPDPIENDTEVEEQVRSYLTLVEELGHDDPEVSKFLSEHSDNPELDTWVRIVSDLEDKGRSSRLRNLRIRCVRGFTAAALSLLLVAGAFSAIGLKQSQSDFRQSQTDLELSRTALATANSDTETAQKNAETLRVELQANKKRLLAYRNVAVTVEKLETALKKSQSDVRNEVTARIRAEKALVQEVANARMERLKNRKAKDTYTKALADSAKKLAAVTSRMSDLQSGFVRMTRDYQQTKLMLAELRRKDPGHNAVLVGCASHIASHDAYSPMQPKDIARMLPKPGKGGPGVEYARALLMSTFENRNAFRERLSGVKKSSPWRNVAVAEIEFDRNGGLSRFVNWLGTIEPKIQDGFKNDLFDASLLVSQRSAALDALVRAYGRKSSDERNRVQQQFLNRDIGRFMESDSPRELVGTMTVMSTLRFRPPHKAVVARLTELLKNESAVIRWHAVRTLGRIGPRREAHAAFDKSLKTEKDPAVRALILHRLGREQNR